MNDTTDNPRGWDRIATTLQQFASSVRRRVYYSRVVQWLLFWGNRPLVTVAILGGVFVVFLLFALLRPFNMEQLVSDRTTLRTLFTAFLSGAILLVSVVASISSVVLSQEISDIETKQERIDATLEFRRRTADLADVEGSPGQPAAFLEVILFTIYQEAKELKRAAAKTDNREFGDRIEQLTEEMITEAKEAAMRLDGAKFGTFKVLSAGLNYDHSWQLNTARRLQNRYEDSLTDEESEALTNLIDTLKQFATGREYFQSLYYKREVARLSSLLLYATLPVIVYISAFLLVLDANLIPDLPMSPLSGLTVFVLFSYTISLTPYVILTAYVLRIAAITILTLAAGPFTISEREHEDVVELDTDTHPEEWDTELGNGADDPQSDEGATEESPRAEPQEVNGGDGETERAA